MFHFFGAFLFDVFSRPLQGEYDELPAEPPEAEDLQALPEEEGPLHRQEVGIGAGREGAPIHLNPYVRPLGRLGACTVRPAPPFFELSLLFVCLLFLLLRCFMFVCVCVCVFLLCGGRRAAQCNIIYNRGCEEDASFSWFDRFFFIQLDLLHSCDSFYYGYMNQKQT